MPSAHAGLEHATTSPSFSPTLGRVIKRDGSVSEFDPLRITNAITKAGLATGEFGPTEAARLSMKACTVLSMHEHGNLTVEQIQDVVEEVLLLSPHRQSAKAFIIYRDQHARLREIATATQADLLMPIWQKWTGRSKKMPIWLIPYRASIIISLPRCQKRIGLTVFIPQKFAMPTAREIFIFTISVNCLYIAWVGTLAIY